MRKLLPLALLLALIPAAYIPAQEAPKAQKPLLLSRIELEIWEAWMRADMRGVFERSQAALEAPDPGQVDPFTVAVMQAHAADELGWHEAHSRNLKALIELHDDELGAYLRWLRIQRLKKLGEFQAADDEARQLGFLTAWWLAGPFPNDRGQGFEDVQEPEQNLSLDSQYTGKEGQPVTWRALPAKPADGVINLGALLRPKDEVTAFLLTAIWADDDTVAEFRIGSEESLKLWRLRTETDESARDEDYDGHPVGQPCLETTAERELGFDQDRATKIPLAKGWNVLLLKAGNSETSWRLHVRMLCDTTTRVAGNAEELATALAESEARNRGTGGDAPHGKSGESPFRSACNELLRPRLDRTSSQPRRDMDKALEAFRARLEKLPAEQQAQHNAEHAVLCYVAAWANRSSVAAGAGREENRRRELLKQCLELDPKAARAAFELSQYYTTTFGNPELADQYAQAAVQAAPGWIEARLYASRVVQMKGLDVEVERALAAMLQQHPDNATVLRYAAYYAGLRRDFGLSNELFEKALTHDHTDKYARDRLIERATQRGDLKTATRHATEARRLDPFDIDASRQLAELHYSAGRYSLAEREVNAGLKIAPRDDTLLELLGRVYASWADSDETRRTDLRAKSVEAYRAALDANPRREDLERYLEFIDGERPPLEAALQTDIEARIAKALASPIDGDNPYEVIFREEIVVVNEDGTTAVYSQEALRVTNDRGREWLTSLRVPAWSGQQGRCVHAQLWHADGSVEQGRRTRWAASFPPLEVGDIVHARFRVIDREQSFFGDFYGAREVLADYVPIREMRLAWVLPKGRQFHEYRTGGAPERAESEIHGRRVWAYTATDIARLEDEPYAPPAHQRAATVQISTYGDWSEFGRWYYNLIRKQLEPTPEMTAKVAELTQGLATERDKARAIYDWVVTNVRYNADWHFGVHGYKPFSAGAVFARCIGDCKDKAILFCTMAGIAGLKAYPVIINLEQYRGHEDITLPMPAHFNHAIALIEYSDGSRQFVDGTTTYNAFDELPSGDAGAEVIVVRERGGERMKVPVPGADKDATRDVIEAEFAPGGVLKLRVTRTAVGDSAAWLRAQYQREGERKRQLEQEWSRWFAGAGVTEISAENISGLSGEPVLRYTVSLPQGYAIKDGAYEFKLALRPHEFGKTGLASLAKRKTDLLLAPPYSQDMTITYTLPAGMKAVNLPAALAVDHPHAALHAAAEMKEGKLVVQSRYANRGGVVKADDYPAFRAKLIEFDSAEAQTIRLAR
ncbi:MAG: hypothetical protein KF696_09810 [Planctomycetes bacterium]|nr:hypothetical protein [Planctomycetota bacterium]MCW8136152.1 hypothetical protein [Planctomycetota bacterium]